MLLYGPSLRVGVLQGFTSHVIYLELRTYGVAAQNSQLNSSGPT